MIRKSKREIERWLASLEDAGDSVPLVVEREHAERAGWDVTTTLIEDSRQARNKYRRRPDPADGEDLVVALVPPASLTAAFASTQGSPQ